MSKNDHSFFITIFQRDGAPHGYRGSTSVENASTPFEQISEPTEAVEQPSAGESRDFSGLFTRLQSDLETYRQFVPALLSFTPFLSRALMTQKIEGFAVKQGKFVQSSSSADTKVYQLNLSCYRKFAEVHAEVAAAIKGQEQLPEMIILGLISSYDAFLGSLLRLVLNRKPHLVVTEDRKISVADVFKFTSLDEVRAGLIDNQVDAILRQSHSEHFDWLEKALDVKLRNGLKAWPAFIELCERRNLLTHTGGIVSRHYISSCRAAGAPVPSALLGTRLDVDSKYFKQAVNVIFEVSAKLCYVTWRILHPQEKDEADDAYNRLCLALISSQAYELAEALLTFSVGLPSSKGLSDLTRRMMVVNLANAKRLQGRTAEAREVLSREDWSAFKGEQFEICIAAVLEDEDKVVRLMIEAGRNGVKPDAFRTWPVFRGFEASGKFLDAFEQVFNESYINSPKVGDDEAVPERNPEVSLVEPIQSTVH